MTMKYKIEVSVCLPPPDDSRYDNTKTIYTQTVEVEENELELTLPERVIRAVNQIQ